MNAGAKVVDWLYREQLQVDEQWSVRTERGFTWWADQNAQTIEVLGEDPGPDGEVGYLVGVRTELLYDLDLTDTALAELNDGPMRFAALAGPVYDTAARTLSICSLARVNDEIADWTSMVLGAAAVTQVAEAHMLGPALAEVLGAQAAVSGHPDSGLRTAPDDMLFAPRAFIEEGKAPCRWPASDFSEAVSRFMRQPPSIGASAAGQALTVEFPYGQRSSLCQLMGEQSHPLYGNGVLLLQRFPFTAPSAAKGVEVALTLNAAELTGNVTGYGFGSYSYDQNMLCFAGFVPNSLHRQVALPNLYFAAAARAHAMSVWLLDEEWTEDSFSPDHSVQGRKTLGDNGSNA